MQDIIIGKDEIDIIKRNNIRTLFIQVIAVIGGILIALLLVSLLVLGSTSITSNYGTPGATMSSAFTNVSISIGIVCVVILYVFLGYVTLIPTRRSSAFSVILLPLILCIPAILAQMNYSPNLVTQNGIYLLFARIATIVNLPALSIVTMLGSITDVKMLNDYELFYNTKDALIPCLIAAIIPSICLYLGLEIRKRRGLIVK